MASPGSSRRSSNTRANVHTNTLLVHRPRHRIAPVNGRRVHQLPHLITALELAEFRDFLLLMPRTASTSEIYRYYQTRKFLGDDGRGPARVNMEGGQRESSPIPRWTGT